MSPGFATVCDPIFMRVIDLLDRLEKRQAVDKDDERRRLEDLFRTAESRATDAASWELAKYALAAWIDEVLIQANWSGRDWWENNSLEFLFFKTRDRATLFYAKATEAAQSPRRDALETYYLCVVFGFRGLYSLDDASFIAEQFSLPPRVSAWAESVASALHLRQGRPRIQEQPRPAKGAAPLSGKLLLVGIAFLTAVVAAATVALGYIASLHHDLWSLS